MIPDLDDFIVKQYRRAIGGVQIVRGDYCREFGYLDGYRKWMMGSKEPFSDFRDDVKFRKDILNKGSGKGIDIPELYRIRHTEITYR